MKPAQKTKFGACEQRADADAEVSRPAALLSAPRDASEVDDFIDHATAPGAASMVQRRAASVVVSQGRESV